MGLLRPAGSGLAESINLDFLAAVAIYNEANQVVLHKIPEPVYSIYLVKPADFR